LDEKAIRLPNAVKNLKTFLSTVAGYIARAPMLLPFVAIPAFVFDGRFEKVWELLGWSKLSIPSSTFIESQYDILLNCKYIADVFDPTSCKSGMASQVRLFDFELFKLFIWIALIFGGLRIATGILNLQSLDRYSEALKTRQKTVGGFLCFFAFFGLFGIFASTNLRYVSDTLLARYLIEHSPRAFLCLHTFLFCTATAFLAEGVLFVIWIAIRRKRLLRSASRLAGGPNG
jgi:hypothetical protein